MQGFEFGNRIYELRKAKGLSQKELGAMLGVSNKAVSKWETGVAMPKTETLIRLAEIFELPADALIDTKTETGETLSSLSAKADSLFEYDKCPTEKATDTRKKAKTYLCCAGAIFISVSLLNFVLFNVGNIGSAFFNVELQQNISFADNIMSSMGIAFLICGTYTGFVWASRIIRKIPSWLTIIFCVLFFITLLIIQIGGMIMVIPTVISSILALTKE